MLNKIFGMPKSIHIISPFILYLLCLVLGIGYIYQVPITFKPKEEWLGWVFLVFSFWMLGMFIYEAVISFNKIRNKKANNAK